MERETGATSRTEYFISYDMAKHLCMLEKTESGHLVRMYFIEQENKGNNFGFECLKKGYKMKRGLSTGMTVKMVD